MTRHLQIERLGPGVSVQDAGRPGGLGLGLSPGGAADRLGYLNGCALLGQTIGVAVLEMAGFGGAFRFDAPARIALSGGRMRATLDGQPLEWNAAHLAGAGARLEIGAVERGVYGYLTVAGGLMTEAALGGRGLHRIAGLGHPLEAGARISLGDDPDLAAAPLRLGAAPSAPGLIRVMPGPQTALFSDDTLASFTSTAFTRSPKANRQGVRLDHDGAPFSTGGQLSLVSDFIAAGDIQMTGDGTPYVLLADCQTMGAIPGSAPFCPAICRMSRRPKPGAEMRFTFVTSDEAEALWQSDEALLAEIGKTLIPRIRDPREMADLLAYELISKPVDE